MTEMRLHRFIAHCGLASRRKAEEMIRAGRVAVNGEIATEMGIRIDTARDAILVDGERLRSERKVYIALHKPRGYVATVHDERDRKIVLDLIEGVKERLYPVGRLDRDSEGLLLLTNDGDLANYLTHPRCGVEKVYRVTVEGYLEDEALENIRQGVRIGGQPVRPRHLAVLHRNRQLSRVEIAVGEGLNREVRRIFAAVGHEAKKLIRLRIGPISLEGLPRGRARLLTEQELRQLRAGMRGAGFDLPAEEAASARPRRDVSAKKGGGPRRPPRGGGPKRGGRDSGGGRGHGGSRGGPKGPHSHADASPRGMGRSGGKPDGRGGKPLGRGGKPLGRGGKPLGRGGKPLGRGGKPLGRGGKPDGRGGKPLGRGGKPVGRGGRRG